MTTSKYLIVSGLLALSVSPAFGAKAPAPEVRRISATNASPSVPELVGSPCPNGATPFLEQLPNQSNGLFSDANCGLCGSGQQSIADNFTLAAPETVEQIVLWGGYFPGNLIPVPPDSFTIIFHSDAAGLPGAAFATQTVVPTSATQTGIILFGVNELVYVVDIAPVALPAGITWVEIFTNSAGNADQFFWEVGNLDPTNGIFNNAFSTAAPGGAWLTGNPTADSAFVLCPAGGPTLSLESVADADQCSSTPGNVNGIWEPGEIISLDITLAAGSASAMTGISGVLTSPTPGVTILQGASTWPDIPANGTAVSDSTFLIQLDEALSCFTTVELDLDVTANEGGPYAFTISGEVGQSVEPVVPVAIPDGAPGGGSSTMNVPSNFNLSDLDVRVEITHTWVGDLTIQLTSPSATTVTLLDRPGVPSSTFGCADNDMNVTFDDETAFNLENHCAATTPWFVGSGTPASPLTAFDGQNVNGVWTLTAIDSATPDTGSIVDWELIATPAITGTCNVCLGLPEVDLAITKSSDAVGPVLPGDPVVFTLQVTNNGPDAATGVVVTDTLPAEFDYVSNDCGAGFADPVLTWNIGPLAASASVTCNISTTVAADAVEGASVNTAVVSGNETDPFPANNTGGIAVDIGAGTEESILEIPTLGRSGMLLLLLALGLAGTAILRRS